MKNSIIQPYLFFDGKCEEALEFYKKTLGASVNMLLRFKDSPEPPKPGCAPADMNKVMHAEFQIGETVIMTSDGRATGNPKFEGFALSLTVKTEAEADKAFNALANGGKIEMPLAKTFFFGEIRHGRGQVRRVLDGFGDAGFGQMNIFH